MTYEGRLIAGLIINAVVITLLSLSIGFALHWSLLALATLSFVLIMTLSFMSTIFYQHWRLSMMNLTSYAQLLGEGVGNVTPIENTQEGLISELQLEINKLASSHLHTNHTASILTLSALMDEWNVAIAVFDQQHTLVYRNAAMLRELKLPMLIGSKASRSGFTQDNNNKGLNHTFFSQQWQTQHLSFEDNGQRLWLFSATNIRQSLQAHESIIQQNLIRVFSHELRNSLTPMASMTDTLLSMDDVDPNQTKSVLTRINQRSSHLLDFIGRYADLSKISAPNLSWFDVSALIDESKTVLPNDAKVIIKGEKRCFGDRSQLSMVFTNLFKNAQQACVENALIIELKIYVENTSQTIEITDNGAGFTSLDNVLTPFYSTKAQGSGIGLALCREIVHQHGGQFCVSNAPLTHGALISMTWNTQV